MLVNLTVPARIHIRTRAGSLRRDRTTWLERARHNGVAFPMTVGVHIATNPSPVGRTPMRVPMFVESPMDNWRGVIPPVMAYRPPEPAAAPIAELLAPC